MLIFWPISAIFRGRIWPKLSKAHLQAKTVYMSLFPGLYDHSLQRNSLEKPMFRKTGVFGHFGQFRSFSVAESGQNY